MDDERVRTRLDCKLCIRLLTLPWFPPRMVMVPPFLNRNFFSKSFDVHTRLDCKLCLRVLPLPWFPPFIRTYYYLLEALPSSSVLDTSLVQGP
ncbi:hypothetical protein CRG98_042903 [Punica granatum]|uniref:Uncharacterized protein n=1 Tax=Punica granatum TaxID=22663 RepID=A0A2I0HYD3_PUNGR|nr:hypothetical protein CRG98_042903 [Punica granatum]